MVLDENVTAAYHTGDGDPPTPEAPGARHGRLARFGAGLLSAIIPGLGHLVTGRRRLAALFLAPVVLGLLVLVGLFLTQNTLSLAASLIDPSIVGAILVLEILFLVWRVAAVVSSMVDRSFPRFRIADGAGLVLVLALVVLPQAGIAVLTSATQAAESDVFVDEPFPSDDAQSAAPSFSPGDSFFPSTEPSASASSALPPRVTVLLIGVDSGVGRNTAATDTMIVASLDPVAKTVSMVSVPRDMVDAPLPKGKTFSPKINGLVANVRWNPGNYPGYSGHGQAVLAYSLGKMLGVHIDYYAQVDLEGFVQAVNAVGGVDVSVDHAMCDARYNEYGFDGYSIGAGRHHMNGNQALAYARIRKSAGESDFTRAARQQQVVVALKDKVVKGGFLNDPLGLLRAVGETIQTNIPPWHRPPARPAGLRDRPEGRLPGGREPPDGPTRVRRARLDPAAELRQDRGARCGDVHAGRHPADRQVRRQATDERGQGSCPAGPELRCRAEAQAEADAQADAQADPEAEADANSDRHRAAADPDADRDRPVTHVPADRPAGAASGTLFDGP